MITYQLIDCRPRPSTGVLIDNVLHVRPQQPIPRTIQRRRALRIYRQRFRQDDYHSYSDMILRARTHRRGKYRIVRVGPDLYLQISYSRPSPGA